MIRCISALMHNWVRVAGLTPPKDAQSLPDFLCIGAPQCGTTWLHRNLEAHPEIYVPPCKEVSYFDRRFHRSTSWYAHAFREGKRLVKGDVTPGYCIMPASHVRTVARLLPEARIILILRDPVERTWSAARRLLGWRYGKDLTNVPDEKFLRIFRQKGVTARSRYCSMLDRWRASFPDERILVLFFEDVAWRPRQLLSSVFLHLGVSTDVDWECFPFKKRINANPVHPLPDRLRQVLQRQLSGDIASLRRHPLLHRAGLDGSQLPSWLRHRTDDQQQVAARGDVARRGEAVKCLLHPNNPNNIVIRGQNG